MPAPIALGALWIGAGALARSVLHSVVSALPSIAAHVLVALGFYVAVAEPLTDNLIQYAMNQFNGVPGTVLESMYYLNVDNYITMIFSAYTTRKAAEAGAAILKARPASGGVS